MRWVVSIRFIENADSFQPAPRQLDLQLTTGWPTLRYSEAPAKRREAASSALDSENLNPGDPNVRTRISFVS